MLNKRGDRDDRHILRPGEEHVGLIGDPKGVLAGADRLKDDRWIGRGVDLRRQPGGLKQFPLEGEVQSGMVGVGVPVEGQAEFGEALRCSRMLEMPAESNSHGADGSAANDVPAGNVRAGNGGAEHGCASVANVSGGGCGKPDSKTHRQEKVGARTGLRCAFGVPARALPRSGSTVGGSDRGAVRPPSQPGSPSSRCGALRLWVRAYGEGEPVSRKSQGRHCAQSDTASDAESGPAQFAPARFVVVGKPIMRARTSAPAPAGSRRNR